MNDPDPLLVPIEVKAMVLNNPAVNFIRGQMNYANLASCQSPSPQPFTEDQVNFATHSANHGIYLLWTLPQAMRHAQTAGGGLAFPFVPNRWLVVRVFRPATTGAVPPAVAPEVAAWVVQSDFRNSPDGSNYLDPAAPGKLTPIQLGRKVAITAAAPWQEPAATTPFFLQAVAESNAAFAAYQPFNENVFSIHDDLETQNVGAGTLSYFVQGWYSDPAADVLAGWQPAAPDGNFAAALAQLGWTATASDQGARTTVCHGAACGVSWVPNSAAPPSPKDDARPRIALANTGIDGIVAFAEAAFAAPGVTPPAGMTPRQAADLLEAFQYNLLPLLSQPGGEDALEQKIRSQWFGSLAAGLRWILVDAPAVPGSPAPPAVSADELAREAAWLDALNAAQVQFDQTMRHLIALQRRLFELWWKQQAAPQVLLQTGSYPWNVTPAQLDAALDPAAPDGLVAQAAAALAQLGTLAAQIPHAAPPVTLNQAVAAFAAGKNLPATRALKAVAEPRFWSPSDPVIVLSGTAHLMTIEPDTTLACRWPGEIIPALTVDTGGSTFSVASSQLAPFQPALALGGLPAVTAALYAEFFLLDPANAPLLAAAAGQALTAGQLAAVAASQAAPAPPAGLVPAVLAPYPWTQPWQPLFLDWSVTWYPIPFLDAAGAPNWAFNGTDYDLLPGVTPPTPVVLTGRSVLTPKPSFEFKSRLDQFIADNPGSAAAAAMQSVENLVETVDAWDFLSQTLGGLTTQISSWSPVPTLVPPATPAAAGLPTWADLVGAQGQCPPNPLLARVGRQLPPSTFEAMRGGQFSLARLTIVDVFGQTLEIVTGQTASQTSVLPGDGLAVTQPVVPIDIAGLVQLPPRLLQPARLNFQFVPAANGNPILGWIIPNHLDGGLAVYGADGILYGELALAVGLNNQPAICWWAAPDTPYATLDALAQAQAQFGGFLAGLQAAGPAALADFLRSVDETLWTVDPLGDRTDAFLSVLLGRPLAVVAASASFELQAEAWRDPAWPYTFAAPPPDPLFLRSKFPVQLGHLASRQDGLLGYFADGDYLTFNAVHVVPPGPGDPPPSSYLAPIGPGNWLDLSFAASGPGPARALTLVMDPRAAVHAQCGLLPTKDVTLLPAWVDDALAAMNAVFRMGPVLAETRSLTTPGAAAPTASLFTPSPAERHGTWSWRQIETDNSWPGLALGPVDGTAVFPDTPPILRDGVLQLSKGLETAPLPTARNPQP